MKALWFVVLTLLSGCSFGGDFSPDPEAVHFSWPVGGYVFQGFYGDKVSGAAAGSYWDERGELRTFNGPGRMHRAIDIDNVRGTPVVAAAGGVASRRDWDNKDPYGNHVLIDHGNGYWTLYAHLGSIAVAEGKTVAQGETVGTVGSTGNSTGPHLHFAVLRAAPGGDVLAPHYVPGKAGNFVGKGRLIPHDYPKIPR